MASRNVRPYFVEHTTLNQDASAAWFLIFVVAIVLSDIQHLFFCLSRISFDVRPRMQAKVFTDIICRPR